LAWETFCPRDGLHRFPWNAARNHRRPHRGRNRYPPPGPERLLHGVHTLTVRIHTRAHAHINSYTPCPLVLCKRTHFIVDGGAKRGWVEGKKEKIYRGRTRCDPKVCACVCVCVFIFIYIYIFFSARSHLFAFAFIRIVTRDVPGTLVFIYYCFFLFTIYTAWALYPSHPTTVAYTHVSVGRIL